MKHKSNWLQELGMSLFFLGVFALVRFILIALGANLQIGNEIIAFILLAVAMVTLVFSFLIGSLRNVFSFSFDAWLLTIIGLFLWNLNGAADTILWFAFFIFGISTVSSAWATLNLFWKNNNPSPAQILEMLDLHDLINRGLPLKFLVITGGALMVEHLLVPIIAG